MNDIDGVADSIKSALATKGYATLTPVQSAILEPAHRGADLLVSAQTGTGKTVAFGLAIAQDLLAHQPLVGRAGAPLALVVAPTRELALQVQRELGWLFADAGAKVASCVGGMDPKDERRALNRGAHIVVGTPGRLVDHIRRGALVLDELAAVVLDEADEMLDLGFREDLEQILGAAPEDRRTLLFSATVSKPIARLAANFQRDAVRVSTLTGREQHADIRYRVAQVAQPDRESAIVNLLRFHAEKKALVFCGTRAMVNDIAAKLGDRGFAVSALSGEMGQKERSQALQAMRDGKARVCVATDVAARGIDLPDLDLVIHADPPSNTEALLHRSGRTGRAGRQGDSVLIATPRARRAIERLLREARVSAEWEKPPSASDVRQRDDARLLEDETLLAPVSEQEREFVARLLAEHGPEQVAAAFLRGRRAELTAPEELREVEPRREKPTGPQQGAAKERRKADFQGGEWIALSIGRDQRADVRWLLPMLCNAGGFTKQDFGAIRIGQSETYVELAAGGSARFMEAIGPDRRLEDGVRVAALAGRPPEGDLPRRSERPKRHEGSNRSAGPKRGPAPERNSGPERNADPKRAGRKPGAKGGAGSNPRSRRSKEPSGAAKPPARGAAPRKRARE